MSVEVRAALGVSLRVQQSGGNAVASAASRWEVRSTPTTPRPIRGTGAEFLLQNGDSMGINPAAAGLMSHRLAADATVLPRSLAQFRQKLLKRSAIEVRPLTAPYNRR